MVECPIEDIDEFFENAYSKFSHNLFGNSFMDDYEFILNAMGEEGYCLKPEKTHKTQKELLTKLTNNELTKLLTWLNIDYRKSWGKKKKAETIGDYLIENPEIYGRIFSKFTLESLKKLFAGEIIRGEEILANWIWCILLGIVEMTIEEDGKCAALAVAQGTQELKDWLAMQNLKILDRVEAETLRPLLRMLISYGAIEINESYNCYKKLLGSFTKEEYFLIIRLNEHVNSNFAIYTNEDSGEEFLCYIPLEAEPMLEKLEIFGQGLTYAEFSKGRLAFIQEQESMPLGNEWMGMASVLMDTYGVPEEALEDIMESFHLKVTAGEEPRELVGEMLEYFDEEIDEYETFPFWYTLINIWIETPIIPLKGHSRKEIAKKLGVSPFTIANLDLLEEEEEIYPEISVWDLPYPIQEKIYKLIKDNGENIAALVRKLKRLNRNLNLCVLKDVIQLLDN